jgi:hypothetical protein
METEGRKDKERLGKGKKGDGTVKGFLEILDGYFWLRLIEWDGYSVYPLEEHEH